VSAQGEERRSRGPCGGAGLAVGGVADFFGEGVVGVLERAHDGAVTPTFKVPGDRDARRDSADGRWLRRRCIAIRFGRLRRDASAITRGALGE